MSCAPSSLRRLICPLRKSPNNSNSTASALTQARLRFRPPPKLFVDSFQRVRRSQRLPLRSRKPQKCEERVTGFLEALDDCRTAQLPFLDETLTLLFDSLTVFRVNHSPI
jgi:hypothetical protein